MTDKGQNIPESIVRLLFDQLKESDTQTKDSIKELTQAITQLIQLLGNNPAEAITLLKALKDNEFTTIITQQKTIIDNYSKLKWIFGIVIAVIGFSSLGFKILEWWAKQSPTGGT